jgi:hypothetical protein
VSNYRLGALAAASSLAFQPTTHSSARRQQSQHHDLSSHSAATRNAHALGLSQSEASSVAQAMFRADARPQSPLTGKSTMRDLRAWRIRRHGKRPNARGFITALEQLAGPGHVQEHGFRQHCQRKLAETTSQWAHEGGSAGSRRDPTTAMVHLTSFSSRSFDRDKSRTERARGGALPDGHRLGSPQGVLALAEVPCLGGRWGGGR